MVSPTAKIRPSPMTGPTSLSWPSPTARTRKKSRLPENYWGGPRSAAGRSIEDFSYFTLRRSANAKGPATSVFGISCTRQVDANELVKRPADVTRSTVQKAVVVIADGPQSFGQVREKLSMVTGAWFAQR